MIRILFTLLSIIMFTTSCHRDMLMANVISLPKQGSPSLIQGTRDGCETAHSSRGNSLLRTFYKFKQNPNLVADDEYFDSWYRGYIYCFHIVNGRTFTPIDADILPVHSYFWNKNKEGNPKIEWAWDQGVSLPGFGEKIKMIGEGENWWNNMFAGCRGVLQCR